MNDKKSADKPVILIICNFYLPGYKSGGGLRTLAHMVERFNDRFDFRVITRDNDGDGIPYSVVKINEWNDVENAKVFYLSKDKIKMSKLRELITEIKPDSIYLNSVFSTLTIFLLVLRKLKLLPKTNIILAPEGELSDGALKLKAFKKKLFVEFSKKTGLYKDLIWKTTAEPEKQETARFKGSGGEIFIAPNMPSQQLLNNYEQGLKPPKEAGEAKMIFLSRYMRKKNLKWLLDNLKDIQGKLFIDIYGPLEDENYWKETQISIQKLPENIKVEYRGVLEYEKALEKLLEYHFFLLPTLSENFGHVFIEAWAAGCPIIISDQTPWLELSEKGIGWDLPLDNSQEWNKIINHCIKLNSASYCKLSKNSREFAVRWLMNDEAGSDTLKVLEYSLTD